MSININIKDYQIKALRDLIGTLRITQAELANKSSYPSSSLSNLLKEPRDSKIRGDKFLNLSQTIQILFNEKQTELRENNIHGEAHKQLMVFTKGINPDEYRIQAPGGSLSWETFNYVERPADIILSRFLDTDSAASILITGGIQCGKTSLINRFIMKAEKKGFTIIHIDFKDFLYYKTPLTINDIFIHIVEKAISEVISKSTIELEKELKARKMAQPGDWAKEYLQKVLESSNNDRVFMIFDSIDSLFSHFESVEEINNLIFWFSMIRNEMQKKPFDKLTIIAIDTFMTFTSHSPVKASPPFKTQSFVIPVHGFEKDQILELGKRIGVENEVESIIDKLYDLFGGHPNLTHKAIFDLYSGKQFSDIELNANHQLEAYGFYWKSVIKNLDILFKLKGYEGKLKAVFHSILNESQHSPAYRILMELFEPFVISGIITKHGNISSGFIKKSIENEI